MSKGNMLLGHARGKVGDLVFSRANGQQVVRARAAVVKNPQTQSQMIQRIILNTVAQAYSKMQPIVDHSFEGIPAGQKTMSAFMRTNINTLRGRVAAAIADPTQSLEEVRAFVPIGSNGFASNAFRVSSGSLPALVPEVANNTTATVALGGVTYAEILEALGLQRGDQLTFMMVTGTDMDSTLFHYSRIILDPTNTDGSQAALNSDLIVGGAVNLPSPRNTGEFQTLSIDAQGVLTFHVGNNTRQVLCVAVIVSRKGDDGTWKRSNADLVLNETALSGLLSMAECLQMFEEGGISTLSSLYLNNAGAGALALTGDAANAAIIVTTQAGTTVVIDSLTLEFWPGSSSTFKYYIAHGGGVDYCIRLGNEGSAGYGRYLCDVRNESVDGSQYWASDMGIQPLPAENLRLHLMGYNTDFASWLLAHGVPFEAIAYANAAE